LPWLKSFGGPEQQTRAADIHRFTNRNLVQHK
jgi:hypothetical protein